MKNFNHFIFSLLLTVKVAAGLLSLVEVETNLQLGVQLPPGHDHWDEGRRRCWRRGEVQA